ncbi:serine/threonine-protein kinase LMTK2-like isoform X2 [Patiria miniata]|uniref:non-specific serine/threonine protein kinase n=1 Tax=Patiria miniata TaxID=46514 RepID=A0A914AKS4_PATMI|nr:serine/threonine-protein kinase LMTK2-like isoform X2 [Patiria miniata]
MKVQSSLPKMVRHGLLAAVLILAVCELIDAASLADTRESVMNATGLSDMTVISILSVASCLCLIIAFVGCASCCKTGFAKFEDTTTETTVVGEQYTRFSDFSPPTMSTPSRPPGSHEPETVTIEPLPQLPGRTSNQWVNVIRVSGGTGGGLDPGQTLQSIKLIDSPRFQFPRGQISYVDEMGNGWFGKVLQGEAQRMHPGLRKSRVVIKQLRDTATPEEQLLFLQEVQPYREVNHPNVLLLLGQCIDSMPLLLILEYAPFGDLKSYLRKHRDDVQQMAQQDIQLKMAADIVSGLMWLHQADFIYIDLATRNCQVSADTSVKIGDYGLALEKYPDDYYITKDNTQAIPIRWLGPEVIDLAEDGTVKTKKITKESNVWSFGIMMLELSTGAKRPYAKLTDEQVLQQVVKEQEIRVDKPNLSIHYAARWFEIMMYCWLEADIRPTMKELHDLIQYLKDHRDRVDMPDFEARWNNLKPAALQESSESGKEDEVAPPSTIQKNPPGFDDDFISQQQNEKPSPTKQSPVIVPPKAKQESPAKTVGFNSDFGSAPVAFIKSPPENVTDMPSPNRNMNAETGTAGDQPLFDDDFVTAVVQPTIEAAPQPDVPVDQFQSEFVTQVEVPATQSAPLFLVQDGGINIKDETPKPVLQSDLVPSSAPTDETSPDISLQAPQEISFDEPQPELDAEVQRTSTPVVSEEHYDPSANFSMVSPAADHDPNTFISTSSLSLSKTPTPNEDSITFHSMATPDSKDQTEFLSFDTANTTPSTNYLTPTKDHTPTMDNTFDTTTSFQDEEPTFIIKTDTTPVDVQSTDPLSAPLPADHSPTEFTTFVTGEAHPLAAEDQSAAAVPSSDVTPLETNESLVVQLSTPTPADHSPTEFTSFVTGEAHPLAAEDQSAAAVPSSDVTPLETNESLVVQLSTPTPADHSPTEFTTFVTGEAHPLAAKDQSAAAVPSSDATPLETNDSLVVQLSTPTPADHSPTEFTSFVIGEAHPLAAEDQPAAAIPSSDATPLETNESLVVEPPGEDTLMQSGFFDSTDSSFATPQQAPRDLSSLSLLPSTETSQIVSSPFTITMSTDGAGSPLEGALSVHSGTGNGTVSHSFTSSSSSSSSTRVMKTTRTVRQVRIVGGQEIVMEGDGETIEGDGVVSVVPGADGDGTVIQTLSGGELQTSSSSFQSTQQTSSSMMRQTSGSEQLASFTVTPGGEMTSSDGTISVTRQMSGEMSSSSSTSSVTRQVSSQQVSSLTSEMSGEATSMVWQMSGESTSSMTRQLSSSSSSSSLTAASSSKVVTSQKTVAEASALQQVSSSNNAISGSGDLTFMLSGDNALKQMGSSSTSVVSHSSSSQSLSRSEMSSQVVSSSEQSGEAPSNVTVSRSMSASASQQQQSSSVQIMTQSSSNAQQPVAFDLNRLSLDAANGNSLVEGEPGTTVQKTMKVTTGPGQVSVGQAMTMQGGGSDVREMENGTKVSVQWQGSAAAKQEHSVFSTEFTTDGSSGQLEGLPGQSSQLAVTLPEGDSTSEGN